MKTFGQASINFYKTIKPDFKVSGGVEVLNPYGNKEVKRVIEKFYSRYYNDYSKRVFILGINPGRFGAGLTGITFTDPIRLHTNCNIENSFLKKAELSSTFIFEVIEKYGGVDLFFSNFYLGAVCPFGFIKEGKNINYYDEKSLLNSTRKFISLSLRQQAANGASRDVAICLGEGKNYNYLANLNTELGLFKKIIPLAHPRFIMQYRRKNKDTYIDEYLAAFKQALS